MYTWEFITGKFNPPYFCIHTLKTNAAALQISLVLLNLQKMPKGSQMTLAKIIYHMMFPITIINSSIRKKYIQLVNFLTLSSVTDIQRFQVLNQVTHGLPSFGKVKLKFHRVIFLQ